MAWFGGLSLVVVAIALLIIAAAAFRYVERLPRNELGSTLIGAIEAWRGHPPLPPGEGGEGKGEGDR